VITKYKFNSTEIYKIATILSVPFCPYHFVQYHFVRSTFWLVPLEGALYVSAMNY